MFWLWFAFISHARVCINRPDRPCPLSPLKFKVSLQYVFRNLFLFWANRLKAHEMTMALEMPLSPLDDAFHYFLMTKSTNLPRESASFSSDRRNVPLTKARSSMLGVYDVVQCLLMMWFVISLFWDSGTGESLAESLGKLVDYVIKKWSCSGAWSSVGIRIS